jgi:hypothetical protein
MTSRASAQCNARHALAPIPPVDEAGDPVVREPVEPGVVLLAVVDAGQLGRCPVLTPSDRDLAVEYERSVRLAFMDKPILEGAVALGAGGLVDRLHEQQRRTGCGRSASRVADCWWRANRPSR